VRKVYHATYCATSSFEEQSLAFKELVSFSNDDRKGYPCEVTPKEYAPLIPKFEAEKCQLEKAGETRRGREIDDNTITLYDVAEGCYNGLVRAQKLGANLRLS
ncbi:MAG: hypothetical protein AABY26_06940, partial [Nanoarchaeota archaeon]